MRINLARKNESGKRDENLSKLLDDLAKPFADEYAMSVKEALLYLFSPDHNTRELVASCLREQDWKISSYSLPPAADGKIYSFGFYIADDCDNLVQWKLVNLS